MSAGVPKSDFQFLGYRLESVRFEGRPPESTRGEHEFTLNLARSVDRAWVEDGQRRAQVSLDVSFHFGGPGNGPFELSARISGVFAATDGLDDATFERMKALHAPALLYSQLRPISRLLTSEGNHNFILPLVNVAAMVEQAAQQKMESPPSE